MTTPLGDILKDSFKSESSDLKKIEIDSVRFYRESQIVEIHIKTPRPLPYQEFTRLTRTLEKETGCICHLYVEAASNNISITELQKYLEDMYHSQDSLSIFQESDSCFHEEKKELEFLFQSEEDAERASSTLSDLERDLLQIGLNALKLTCNVAHALQHELQSVNVPVIPERKKELPNNNNRGNRKYYRQKKEAYPTVALKDINDPQENIQFIGTVFHKEDFEIKSTHRIIQSLSVYDGEDAIVVKRFEGRSCPREQLDLVNEKDRIHVYGSIQYDNYAKDLVCNAQEIEVLDPIVPKDTAKEKRVELHCHTNMSEMDGVCETKDIIKFAWDFGHPGITLTDHADVQSFAKAYNTAAYLKKDHPDHPFKVGLGCEMNMVDEHLTIVRNGNDTPLKDLEYIAFDLETTGLSCKYDSIIEFGAVKIKNSMITDRKQMFIKPPVSIPAVITAKTKITNEMVKDAKPFAEAVDELLDWMKDDVLVAHNATFDYFFFNEELKRIGRKPLSNPVIDTLDLSRAILKERRAYRLGNIARNYHIAYDEETAHRADYDAQALAGVFLCLLKDSENQGAKTLNDLQTKVQDEKAFMKVRRSHICVLVKNQKGVKDLYELVTESNIDTLAVMGKANGKEGSEVVSEPRILRSSLEKRHSNLLFGSACYNSEVFELACNGDDARLENAMKFYDYIELQPLGNYSTYLVLGNIPSMERLKQVQKRIIEMAKKLDIPVCATSDAHYCVPSQKKFRDVYIMSQGVGGVAHPLYIRDEALRWKTKNPDQHIRSTEEMLKEFAWLEDENLIHEIVIENPNKIFDSLEEVRPVPKGTFPPFIKGSSELLTEVCYKTAHETYGETLPKPVEERLTHELKAIIDGGYGVNYYISHLLVKQSNKDGYLVGSRGSVGSSFVATMAKITEVNPLMPHYVCPHCHHSEFIDDPEVRSGFDLPDKKCPKCGTMMKGDGQNIPFETFLGFKGDKVPDIDLNFSNDYQAKAHAFTKGVFGEDHVFRAGTIGTVAEKTAFGYVSGYCEKMNITNMRKAFKDFLANGCQNVKRTTGQHPGGIIVIPADKDASDFTPVQYPANDPNSEWKTTHFDFHDIHDNVLKFDILGHVDPTAMRLLQNVSGIDPHDIPMNDPETLSLFSSDQMLKADPRTYHQETGALGLPEFGTKTTRRVLELTRPKKFSDLVIISGLSHGTGVWAGNSEDLVHDGHPLQEVIGCRDDIMTYLLEMKLEPIQAFKIMEDVRHGKGLKEEQEALMREKNVPEWYIDSCNKIQYMFPKAHAVAYVIMAVRIAWFKVHLPHWFYVQFLSLRCDAYEIETMKAGMEAIRARLKDIGSRMNDRFGANPVTNKERALYDTLEVCEEMYARGYKIGNIDLYKSKATEFTVLPDDLHTVLPPFNCIDGLGDNVARSIVKAREQGNFLSKEDLMNRSQLSSTLLRKLEVLGCLEDLQDKNQMSLF